MKKAAVLCVIIIIALLFPVSYVMAQAPDNLSNDTFLFPLSLRYIEDEAFAGTSAKTVILQKDVLLIGNNAFTGAKRLTDIYIPPATDSIASSAIPHNPNLVIHGAAKSYVQTWANERGILFVVDNVWQTTIITTKDVRLQRMKKDDSSLLANIEKTKLLEKPEDENMSMRPQDRPELNPIDYRFP